ncbi:hypothetical protein BAY59_26435 [Prauserella coralliicola]|nr:hypothetical protein BAY59_26435 [Prauserella coralliicola]
MTFLADDGRVLAGNWFRPSEGPSGAVLLVPAMATPASFYGAFASWLAERGFLTLTFDYRGMGGPSEMRAEQGDMLRWAGDAASALQAMLEEAPAGLPVTWLGHSLGGQLLPFARHDLIDHALLVASGLGYYRWNTPRIRRVTPLLRVVAPMAIRVAGYYPGRRLRMLGDVPPNVMRQWARWCMSPKYYGIDVPDIVDRAREITLSMDSLTFTDDELLGERSHQALESLYAASRPNVRRVAPRDHGLQRIGHHGFFRARMRPLWDDLALPRLPTR